MQVIKWGLVLTVGVLLGAGGRMLYNKYQGLDYLGGPEMAGTVKHEEHEWSWSISKVDGQYFVKVRTPAMGGGFPGVLESGPYASAEAAKAGALADISNDAENSGVNL